ncbi:MAG: YdcF family protein [Ruminococcus sp.]|nr:YdcF family protein [Ruminococcus sp.]
MPKKIRKRFIILNLFIALCLLLSLVFVVFSAREYTSELTASFLADVHPESVTYETDNDHIKVTDIRLTDDAVLVTVKPLTIGKTVLTAAVTLQGDPEPSLQYARFFAGPFGTVFALDPYLDFAGSQYIVHLMILCLLVVMTVMFFSYFDYLKRSDYGYPMVACGGVGLFCLFYFVMNLVMALIFGAFPFSRTFSMSFGSYIYQLSSSSDQFVFFTAPLMFLFSLALTVSNLALIRREGFRFVNLLGILFGVLWVTGFVINQIFDENSSGSMLHGAIFTSISDAVATVICYFECMLFSTILSAFLASRHKPETDRDYIIILGCSIRKDGTLTPLLKGRVDAALSFAKEQKEKTGKPVKFVPSGGQGSDETISEGEAMKRYLLEQNVPEEMILPETQSVNTYQNVKFSKEVIEQDTKEDYNAAFATTNYHIFRGYILSKKNKLKNAQGISAKTKWYFFPNAFLREMVGLIVDERRTHLVLIGILVIFMVLMNITFFL